jgi:hypothetical protein
VGASLESAAWRKTLPQQHGPTTTELVLEQH